MRRNQRRNRKNRNNRRPHSERGIFSTVCAVISLMFFAGGIGYSVIHRGNADLYAGSVGFVALLFAFMGLIGGISGFFENNVERLFCFIGGIINLLLTAGFVVLAVI